ncbi:MAG: hypothetical protein Q7S40_30340 [Opitutaceae bacterium]|nr:hypothetical protein [Opitutaceae bacterium]
MRLRIALIVGTVVGYEGGDAMIYFGRPGPFGSAVEEIIVAKVQDLMAQVADGAPVSAR